jgi:hypothetical protein
MPNVPQRHREDREVSLKHERIGSASRLSSGALCRLVYQLAEPITKLSI